jgi:cell division protease FtsH
MDGRRGEVRGRRGEVREGEVREMSPDVRSLNQGSVISGPLADVARTRERARRRRLRRIAVVVGAPTAFLWYRILSGHPFNPFRLPTLGPDLLLFLPGLALIVLFAFVFFVPMLANGRSPHVTYRPEEIGVGLSDVKGLGPVVEEVVKTLNLFLGHELFRGTMGGTPRRGILFEGPPGTGKTYVAKAMAKEAGVPFLFVSSSAFQSMYYGQTAKRIRSFFRALRKAARAEGGAIGFIEEIDAIGMSRGGVSASPAGPSRAASMTVERAVHEGTSGVVNELLIQMQSFDEPPGSMRARNLVVDLLNRYLPANRQLKRALGPYNNILIVGATNRADSLDPALLRPGRFDRVIHFDLPNRAGRREIIDYYLGTKAHEPSLDDDARRDALAAMSFGYTPVMIEHLFDEALVWALRRGATELSLEDISRAKFTEELGLAQPVSYTDSEKIAIATHEAGHAVVAYLVGKGRKLEILSIIKRRDALGLLAHSDTEERFTKTRSELLAMIGISLGGMVAEEMYFGESGTGPGGDLVAATTYAATMVGSLGMGGSLISYEAVQNMYMNVVAKVLSNREASAKVDKILKDQKDTVRGLLDEHRHLVEALRDALLDREELIGDEILDALHSADLAADTAAAGPAAADPIAAGAATGEVDDEIDLTTIAETQES